MASRGAPLLEQVLVNTMVQPQTPEHELQRQSNRARGASGSLSASGGADCGGDFALVTYDANEFVRPGEVEDAKCKGCRRVPSEPWITKCCGHVYCLPCLTAGGHRVEERGGNSIEGVVSIAERSHLVSNSEQRGCPDCDGQQDPGYFVDQTRQKILESREIHCPNEHCDWSGSLRERQTAHTEICEHAPVPCPNMCTARILRKDLAQHVQDECRYREYTCKHCDYKASFAEVMGLDPDLPKHRCPMIRINCPNKCNTRRTFLRRDIAKHLRTCPSEILECPFKCVGCTASLIRKNYNGHMKMALEKHLHLLLTAFQTKTKALRDEIGLLTQTVHDPTALPSLACMKVHMQLGDLILSAVGDEVSFRVPHFSELQRCSNEEGQWQSPAFFFLTGFKMELLLCPGGVGTSMGTWIAVSLVLHKPAPEQPQSAPQGLEWPMDIVGRGLQVSLLKQCTKSPAEGELEAPLASVTTNICSLCNSDTLAVLEGEDPATLEVMRENHFFPLENLDDSGLLLHNSVVVRVEMVPCACVPRN